MLIRLIQGGVVFLVGAVTAMQPPINAALAKRTGALPASTISFLIGTVALLLVSLAARHWIGGDFSAARGAPWWQLTGGLLGALFVAASVIMVPRLGAAGLIAALIAGQIAGSLIIDQFGLFGLPRLPVSAYRILGLGLLAVGGMLTLKRWTTAAARRPGVSAGYPALRNPNRALASAGAATGRPTSPASRTSRSTSCALPLASSPLR